MSTWTPPFGSARHISFGRERLRAAGSTATTKDTSSDRLRVPVMLLRDVVTTTTVRADHATERALPCPLLADVFAPKERGPAPKGASARGWRLHSRLHLSLLPEGDRAGRRGCQPPHVPFRVASFSHGAPPRRDEASTRREAFHLHAAACWFQAVPATLRQARSAHLLSPPSALASRSYSGLPCAREHLPRTGGDFGHDQHADSRQVQ
jgi:hypothetical protein